MKPENDFPEDYYYEDSSHSEESLTGLLLAGTVVDRTRRYVPKDNPKMLVVTYTFEDNLGHQYYVDDFEPSECFEVGMFVTVNVYVKPYIKRNKEAGFSLGLQRQKITYRGERF